MKDIWSLRHLESYRERYELAMERIGEIAAEPDVEEPFRDYFQKVAAWILQIRELVGLQEQDFFETADLEALAAENHKLYADILPDHYGECYGNPSYAVAKLGEAFGGFLSVVYTEISGMVAYAFDYRYDNITIFAELFIELYNIAESSDDVLGQMKDSFYWFMSDYCDTLVPQRINALLDPEEEFTVRLIDEADLTDLRYLYRLGEYIGEPELKLAEFMNSLPEEKIRKMARNYVDGFVRGYEMYRIDLAPKKTVDIRYLVGMERLVKTSFAYFRDLGLEPVCYRRAVCSLNKRQNRRVGFAASGPNLQFDYDHRFDDSLYMGKKYKERRLEVVKTAYEAKKNMAAECAGPVLVEGFGQKAEEMVRKPECLYYNAAQEEINGSLRIELTQLTDQYIKSDESSFCIVSYPVPEIGGRFEEIFDETIRVNTLDVDIYREVHQHLIDALDAGVKVHVAGKGANRTEIEVALWDCDPITETKFENCLADVNIPLGEVFTSPKLTGTNGRLHVTRVFLNGMEYKDLEVLFTDGKISGYSCRNFDTEEANRAYIKENILFNHEWLPLGEFAIGTNTTAYAMAVKYGIFDKLDILIAEKTGPHFAVGDTCYSYQEDHAVYNPDGKEIIARDNEVVRLRTEDPSKAYFSCHTDITIPYDELGLLEVVHADGSRVALIRDGRFVLPGTEILNEALEEIRS